MINNLFSMKKDNLTEIQKYFFSRQVYIPRQRHNNRTRYLDRHREHLRCHRITELIYRNIQHFSPSQSEGCNKTKQSFNENDNIHET